MKYFLVLLGILLGVVVSFYNLAYAIFFWFMYFTIWGVKRKATNRQASQPMKEH